MSYTMTLVYSADIDVGDLQAKEAMEAPNLTAQLIDILSLMGHEPALGDVTDNTTVSNANVMRTLVVVGLPEAFVESMGGQKGLARLFDRYFAVDLEVATGARVRSGTVAVVPN